LAISDDTYYTRQKNYGKMKLDQLKRLKQLEEEKENSRLKKLVAEHSLDIAIFKKVLSGNY